MRGIPGAPLLEVEGLSVAFGGLQALANVSFAIQRAQIKAVIGPNGAGKSTLFNALTGVHRASSGHVRLRGVDITASRTHAAAYQGLARTFQNVRLFQELTVCENVMVGMHCKGHVGLLSAALHLPRARAEERAFRESSRKLLAFVGLLDAADELAGGLPMGQQRLLEVARALAAGPELLLLDEPAAGLNDTETQNLATLLHQIRDSGVTILLVEHNMDLVMAVSDEVVVLNYGEKIAEGTPADVQNNPDVIEAYLGVSD